MTMNISNEFLESLVNLRDGTDALIKALKIISCNDDEYKARIDSLKEQGYTMDDIEKIFACLLGD